jgi:hypothetical protein
LNCKGDRRWYTVLFIRCESSQSVPAVHRPE